MESVADLLIERACSHGPKIAVESGKDNLSYDNLLGLARRYAKWYRMSGLEGGDRVAILLPRSISALAAFFGVHLANGIVVFVGDSLKGPQISYILEHSQAKLVVTHKRLRNRVEVRAHILDVSELPLAEAGGYISTSTKSGDLAALIYTSGSTGKPKGIMVTHGNLLAGARIVANYLNLNPSDRVLSILPWNFDYGLNQVLSTFYAAGTVVIGRSGFAPDVCRLLHEAEITGLAGVPPMWALLTKHPSPLPKMALPHLRYITNSGGMLPPSTINSIRAAHPHLDIYLMYGLTEAFRSTYLPPDLVDLYPDSIGIPIAETKLMVVGEDGTECASDVVGELVHGGVTVAAGYWRDEDTTARVFRPISGAVAGSVSEIVVYSGDYVRRDKNGLLYYVGRRDELFKSRGIRVNPSEIEASLLACKFVSEAVVMGVSNSSADASIVAVVVPTDIDVEDRLWEHCEKYLPGHLQPDKIIMVSALPRTSTLKLDRSAIRKKYSTSYSKAIS
ncbi:AMP-binding protein [Nocardia arthritidis]|uniref:AMP-binding protein n=1 Tax=Nocardia arthritidis TaxID=228602 RepID=A0A6G9Y9C8_9NOCA|nr:AMP-binding protein [Nocardia arthritidis]QIS09875.1 AMP-binding protein [Nocardia arthritidis]